MSAQPQQGGLAKAQSRIEDILADLNSTVASVEELTRRGEANTALRLVEDQREALYRFVDSIAADVAVRPPRFHRLRRSAGAIAVAASLLVSSIAVATVASRDDAVDASDLRDIRSRMNAARSTQDPAERLAMLNAAAGMAGRLSGQTEAETDIASELGTMIDDTRREIERGEGSVVDGATDVEPEAPDTNRQREPEDPLSSITDLSPPDVAEPGPAVQPE